MAHSAEWSPVLASRRIATRAPPPSPPSSPSRSLALDELIVVPIHYWFAWRFAFRRGAKVLKLPWRSIQRIIWYGAAARLVANFSLGLIPVAGAFANAVTAIALTEYLARYLDDAILNPDAPRPEITMSGLKDLFTVAIKKKQDEEQQPQRVEKANGASMHGGAS